MSSSNLTETKLIETLQGKIGSHIRAASVNLDMAEVVIDRENMKGFFQILKNDSDLAFDMLLSVTAVDWMDLKEQRFEVVYHLVSLRYLHRLRIKIAVPEQNIVVDSITDIWKGANFMEREVWDMYGIQFRGHPDLRRILMYEEFVGFPLRKDYPVQAKQPRIPLRSPEVRNTAVDMIRPVLVQIQKKVKVQDAPGTH